MKKRIVLLIISLCISVVDPAFSMDDETSKTVQRSQHKTPTKNTINPYHNLFEKEEQFSAPEKNDLVLKVNFSEPIYKEATYINFDDPSDSTKTIKVLMKNSTFFDIISDGKCVGKIKTDIMPGALNDVYIRKIKVDAEHQGKGIGTKAIGLLVQFYLQKGFKIEGFGAQIKKDNVASIRMFEKNDFLTNGQLCIGMFAYFLKV